MKDITTRVSNARLDYAPEEETESDPLGQETA